MNSRMDQRWEYKIEVSLEQFGSLRITEENTLERITEYIDNILIVLAVYNKTVQPIMPKSIVPDLG